MTSKSFLFPVIYSAVYIGLVCFTFYGGHANRINLITNAAWLLTVPFCVAAMIYAKKNLYHNHIGGKEAVKEGFKFLIFSTLILVIFQAIFFTLDFKEYKINFMQTYGPELTKAQIAKGYLSATEAQIPDIIAKDIGQVTLFRECTSIVFKNLFLGIITSVICAVALRNKVNTDILSQ
jgi:hypothetical protein